ncbi:MAG: FAD-dependent monooxygenase [Pseudomonadota bacterium]
MQYHYDGFRPGDPTLHTASAHAKSDCDVLIVGSGPAGLTLAAYLAQFPTIRTRLIERRDGPLIVGQADGIACRSMEMFEVFGFAHQIMREAYWVNETTFWKPDAHQRITRSGRIQDVEDGLSEFPHVILSQARVQDFYLETMRKSATRLEPDYSTRVTALDIPEDPTAPVTVTLDHHDRQEIVTARYVVGCDGARSTVRRSLGLELQGEAANAAWGVMDVLAVTDFPDIRLKCAIQSATEGSLLIIPREGGYMVRLYIELDKLNPDERVADREITADDLIAAAGRILAPYTLDVREIAWWSVYEIGQRLTDRFTDDADAPRVFIAGDACHTHSPKAGQGMNVSMADAFNLGWKLQAVIDGHSPPELLRTYSDERQAIAQELIDFDKAFAGLFASGAAPEAFQRYFQQQGRYTAGVATRYAPSILRGPDTWRYLAQGFRIGTRLHSARVIRWADAKQVHLGHVVEVDGLWRAFHFAGDDPEQAIDLMHTFAEPRCDTRLILQTPHRDTHVPPTLFRTRGTLGLRNYDTVFCADPSDDIYDTRGIDRQQGALVLLRPDQYVAHVLPLDAHTERARFFAPIFAATSA